MKIAILGAGALGSYYGAVLSLSGADVSFIMRSAYQKVSKEGIQIKSTAGDIRIESPKVYPTPEACGPVDLVFVCWKSTVNHQLAQALPPLLHENTKVVTLQNGMGNAEEIQKMVKPENIFVGLCYICVMLEGPGCIDHSGPNDVRIAPYIPSDEGLEQAQVISGLFMKAGINSRAYSHYEYIMWDKLSWNIPFNGLCLAHGGLRIEQLLAMPDQVERARRVLEEVCLCASMRGFALHPDLVESQMNRTFNMTTFIPSSALDYLNERPVEYDAIWGIPLQRALEAGVPVPHWEQLACDIRNLLAKKC